MRFRVAKRPHPTTLALIAGLTLCAGAASAQRFQPAYPIVQPSAAPPPSEPASGEPPAAAVAPDSRAYSAGQTIGDIVAQPTKDIGINKTQIQTS